MNTDKLIKKLQNDFPKSQFKLNQPLAPYTTLQIGGPADLFFIANTESELIKAIRLAQKFQINWIILGWGSNVLISDNGFRGLVIRNQSNDVQIKKTKSTDLPTQNKSHHPSEVDRHDHAIIKNKKYPIKFDDLDYDETHLPYKLVKVSSGFNLGRLISWTIENGLTGLQWFNRIPGTVGGAVFNNIHGGSHYFEEYLHEIEILTPDGKITTIPASQIGFGYDKTRFHHSQETIINATLKLYQGDVERAKKVAMEWAKRKSVQPRNSPGCTFQNITQEDKQKLGYPTTSAGYIIEWILKWSNKKIGNAKIYDKHHNFIINEGHATAKDYLELIKQIIAETKTQTGLTLKPEIFFIGFTDQELKGVTH